MTSGPDRDPRAARTNSTVSSACGAVVAVSTISASATARVPGQGGPPQRPSEADAVLRGERDHLGRLRSVLDEQQPRRPRDRAGTDQQHTGFGQGDLLTCRSHSFGSHAPRMAADLGVGPRSPARPYGVFDKCCHEGARGTGRAGDVQRVPDLPQDLRFSEDHGLGAGRDPPQVPRHVTAGVEVGRAFQRRARDSAIRRKQVKESVAHVLHVADGSDD